MENNNNILDLLDKYNEAPELERVLMRDNETDHLIKQLFTRLNIARLRGGCDAITQFSDSLLKKN